MSFVFWSAAAAVCAGLFLVAGPRQSSLRRKTGTGILLAAGLALLTVMPPKSLIEWQVYDEAVFERMVAEKQPVLVYFSASWCYPCYELDRYVFSRRDVAERLEPFIKLKVDLSKQNDPIVEKVIDQYQLAALPVMDLYIEGERTRIQGFLSAEDLLKRIREAEK